MGLFEKLFGTRSQRELKKIQPLVDQILGLEEEYRNLSEEALRGKTQEFKNRLAAGETLDDLLPEAFAAIREAADRVLGMRPYPVQLMGGIILHQGRIAIQRPKMSRFLNAYNAKCCKFSPCRLPKIGTFSGVGWRGGGWILKEGAFARSASLSRLLLVLFLPKQEKYIPRSFTLQKGISFCKYKGAGMSFCKKIPRKDVSFRGA